MCRARELIGHLSEDEREALRALGGPAAESPPSPHEDALMRFGFAELVAGGPQLTGQGRRALALLGG